MSDTTKKTTSNPVAGAAFMVAAGVCFAIVNVITQKVTNELGLKSTTDAFWLYAIAALASLPLLVRHGFGAMRTAEPMQHIIRVLLAAMGVQAWVLSLAQGVPIFQVIALVMTSPFFVILGAKLFLNEPVGAERWLAAIVAFIGAMIVLAPWSTTFTVYSLLPVAAAILWGGASLMMKHLTKTEPSETITIWLLVLLTPINLGLSISAGFEWPTGTALWLLLTSGVAMMLAQYLLTRAYEAADASFVQPFDDLKLPFNIIAGWLAFGYAPAGSMWLGIALILLASLWLLWRESRSPRPIAERV